MTSDWNINTSLEELIWDHDLKCSPALATEFLTQILPAVYNLKLKTVSMIGVFSGKNLKIKGSLEARGVKVILE